VSGTWRGPPPTSAAIGSVVLGFEVSSDAEPLCSSGDGWLTLATQVRVRSADGSLDWTTEVEGGIRSGEGYGSTSDPPSLGIGATALFQDADDLRRAGLGEVDLLGGPLARVQFDATFFAYPDHTGHTARLDFFSVLPCSSDPRCAQHEAGACPFCGSSSAVRRLDSPSVY
jgi:hypothetical protein